MKKNKKISKIKKKNTKSSTLPGNRLFIEKIKIENFKSFKDGKDAGIVKFAPMINLIFGKNSAGKSSIFQALRLYRQSYSPGNTTPFNYEAPPAYKGRGGIDIDIGYQGIVNGGDLKKKIGLGVDIGSYNRENYSIKKHSSIEFKYRFVSKFYKGKNLIKNKTVPTSVNFFSQDNTVTIDFPKYNFFKKNSSKFKFLVDGEFRGPLGRGLREKPESNPYGDIYDPFYFDAKINLKSSNIASVKEVYKTFNLAPKEKILDILQLIFKSLKRRIKIEAKSKGKDFNFFEKYAEDERLSGAIRKKIDKEVINKKLDLKEKLSWCIKNSEFAELFFYDVLGGSGSSKNKILYKMSKIENLIDSIKKNKISTESKFYNHFTSEIEKENSNLIFYNGKFINNNPKTMLGYNPAEDVSNYSINYLIWILLLDHQNRWAGREQFINVIMSYNNEYSGKNDGAVDNVNICMNKMIVVPGLRSMPKRYFVKGMQTNYIGAQAENLAELLANPRIRSEVDIWLKKLDIPYRIAIESSGNYYEIVFKPEKNNLTISQTHVGLGYPLILPLIVQCLIARNKIIMVEEPELHLHPKLEADLAELIIYSAKNRENQFLIETHSEDFLLRLLKNVRQNNLEPKDISINYITNEKNKKIGSVANKIQVNKYGQYTTPWKDDLFAERRKNFNNK